MAIVQTGALRRGKTVRYHRQHGQRAAPAVLSLGGGVGVVSPYSRLGNGTYVPVRHYTGPDGNYDSFTDLSQEIQGIGCQRRALIRWGYTPAF